MLDKHQTVVKARTGALLIGELWIGLRIERLQEKWQPTKLPKSVFPAGV